MKRTRKFFIIYSIGLLAVLFLNFYTYPMAKKQPVNVTYYNMVSIIEKNKDSSMQMVEKEDGTVLLTTKDGTYTTSVSPKQNLISDLISKYPISYTYQPDSNIFDSLFSYIIPLLPIILILVILNNQKKSNNSVTTFAKTKTKETKIPNTTMNDIGGLSPETKNEIQQIVNLFNNQAEARILGLRPSKGLLLYGPPGTGKTLLAKAMANAVNANFYPASGSSFVEMYVGVGAARMRDLFEKARQNAPSLIFIDEIDAIAGERKANGSEERENTLNELLVQLDGISTTSDVFFICATNRIDILDPAILRPGRLDYKVLVNLPDLEGRKEIIEIHRKGKPLSDGVLNQLDNIAVSTTGYSGADIESLFLTAANHAFANGKRQIEMDDIHYALDRAILGNQNRKINDLDTKRRVAFHEAGHALIGALVKPGSIRKATIIPRGYALGFVAHLPKEMDLSTKSELIDQLKMMVAGGVAETKIFGQHSIGVSDDLRKARELTEQMVDRFGMTSDDLMLPFSEKDKEAEMKRIYEEALRSCQSLLEEHHDKLEGIAHALLEKETLEGDEIQEIVFPSNSDESTKENEA